MDYFNMDFWDVCRKCEALNRFMSVCGYKLSLNLRKLILNTPTPMKVSEHKTSGILNTLVFDVSVSVKAGEFLE
jgi:hypothetical protein